MRGARADDVGGVGSQASLRSKIGDHLITTVRGEGYRLAAG
jgi:hypothetical protein